MTSDEMTTTNEAHRAHLAAVLTSAARGREDEL